MNRYVNQNIGIIDKPIPLLYHRKIKDNYSVFWRIYAASWR